MIFNHETGSIESLLKIDTTVAPQGGGNTGIFEIVGGGIILPTATSVSASANVEGAVRFNTTTQRIEFVDQNGGGVETPIWMSAVTEVDVENKVNVSYLRDLLDAVYVDHDALSNEFEDLVDGYVTTEFLTPLLDATYVNVAGDTMALNASLTFNGGTVTGLAAPVNDSDAATKLYADTLAQGLDAKESVRAATSANVDLTTGGLLTVDGVTLVAGDRVLVRAQSDAKQNGIYVAAEGEWVRSEDQNGTPTAEVSGGNFTFVEQGTVYGSTGWVLQGDGELALGTDNLVWIQFSAAGQYTAGAGLSKTGLEFSIENDGVLTTLHGGTGLDTVGAAGTVLSANAAGDLEYKTVSASEAAGKLGATVDIADGSIVIGTTAVLSVAASTTTTGLTVSASETAQDVSISVNLNTELQALSQLSTTGLVARTAAGTYTPVTIAGTNGNIVVTNGDGVAGAPTINLASITQNTTDPTVSFVKVQLDGFGRVIGNLPVTAADLTGGYSAGTGISLGTAVEGVIPINNTGLLSATLQTANLSLAGPEGDGLRTDGTTPWSSGILLNGTQGDATAVATVTLDQDNSTLTLRLNSALESLANLDGSGLLTVDTDAGVYVERAIEGTTGNIVVTDGDGVLGNPVVNLASVTQAGTGSFVKVTIDSYGRVSGNTAVVTSDIVGLLTAGTSLDATDFAAGTIDLATITQNTTNPTASFVKVELDTYGRVIGNTAVTTADITGLVDATYVNVSGDTMAENANLTFNGGEVLGLPAIPSSDTAATSKAYVDSVAQGLDPKASVRTIATADITLFGLQTLNGVSLAAGDRVLVTGQAAPADNGIYAVVDGGAWTRTTDMSAWAEIPGAFVFVEEGTNYADTGWVCTSNQGGTLGTTAVNWVQFSAAGMYTAGDGLSLDGLTFSIENNGVLTAAHGGTGLSTYGTANQVLGMNADATALEYKTNTAGAGISITDAAGTITFANTGLLSIADSTGTSGLSIDFTTADGAVSTALSGTLVVGNGGTGLSAGPAQDGQLLIGSAAGSYTLATLSTGNGISVTNGAGSISIANTGLLSIADSSGTTGLSVDFTTSSGDVTTSLSGTLAATSGGTGLSSAPSANGQLLIGSAAGTYTLATLTQGPGISITNDAGSITIAGASDLELSTEAEAFLTLDDSVPGTTTIQLDTQAVNTVFAGPSAGGAAKPTFRTLAYADLPIVNYTETSTSQSTITATAVDVVSNDVSFGAAADAKTGVYTSKVSTTDATVGTLAIGTQAAAGLWTYTITIAAIGTSDQAAYKLEGGVMYNGTTSTVIGGSKSILAETTGAQAWDVSVASTGGVLSVQVTGAAATNIKWVASAVITEATA